MRRRRVSDTVSLTDVIRSSQCICFHRLNLTCANRVVKYVLFLSHYVSNLLTDRFFLRSLDLAWNYATEAQAYDRVHRLGQHKPVSIQRLIIKNTIEER